MASAQGQPSSLRDIEGIQGEKATLKVQYGDFSAELAKVVVALNEVFYICFDLNDSLLTSFVGQEIHCERSPN